MGHRRRLLFVINDAAFFLSHRLPIARAALEAGWDVHVAARADAASTRIAEAGLSFQPIPITRSGLDPLRNAALLLALTRLYRRLRPDVVHHVTTKPILFGGIAARAARVPAVVMAVSGLGYVFTGHGGKARVLRRLVEPAYRFAFRHPNLCAIFQNPDDQARLQGLGIVGPDRSVLVGGSGVDVSQFRGGPEPEGAPVAMLPSRMLAPKGVREFVQAATLLKKRNPQWRFLLAGGLDPHNPEALHRDEIARWQAEGAVEWLGHRDDMPATLNEAHVICLPSYYGEGLPKVLLEAAACERPVVTTDEPGCRDAIEDGQTGLLVPSRDPSALADALDRLMSDPALRRRMGQAGRARVEAGFTAAHVAERHLEIYDRLTSTGSGDGR